MTLRENINEYVRYLHENANYFACHYPNLFFWLIYTREYRGVFSLKSVSTDSYRIFLSRRLLIHSHVIQLQDEKFQDGHMC